MILAEIELLFCQHQRFDLGRPSDPLASLNIESEAVLIGLIKSALGQRERV